MSTNRFLRFLILFSALIFTSNICEKHVSYGQISDDPAVDLQVKMEQQRKESEFQKLKDLAEQLQKKSGELKEMIDQSNRHTVSLALVKKIEEIEKVLKEIKNRTKPH
jgi:peptidoglycan hydrolase CwlO-like protein